MNETGDAALAAHGIRHELTRALTRRFGDEAEDCVGEALVRCCSASTTDDAHAQKLAARIATGLAIDASRHRAVARKYAPKLADPSTSLSAEEAYLDLELRQRVAAAVIELPPYPRAVMQAFAEGADNAEIARRVGRSVYAIKGVIARSIKQLREQLRDVELALVGFCVRHRRGDKAVVTPVFAAMLPALLPALAITLAVTSPAAASIALQVLHGAGHQATMARTLEAAWPDAFDATASTGLREHGRFRGSPVVDLPEPVDDTYRKFVIHADRVVDRVPHIPATEATTPDGGNKVGAEPSEGRYDPDPDDPVGDLIYCLTHEEVSPTHVGCDEPS